MGLGIWDRGYGIRDMGLGIWDMGYGRGDRRRCRVSKRAARQGWGVEDYGAGMRDERREG